MAESLEQIITFLEQRQRPQLRVAPPHRAAMLLHAEEMTAGFYRYLYRAVGASWRWWERAVLDDEELLDIVTDPLVEIAVLYVGGIPAGYFELDRRVEGEVEIAYLGLVPEFIGRGLGTWLVALAVDAAWSHEPERVWVHTCDWDHPRALLTYQRAGFRPYDTKRVTVDPARLEEAGL
ncbi:MAG: GNAT family N-acetyltransferase [Acidimicrobiia bacterium]|nr:GNAT family N-acetyltransferase [Acidimicrobiia bacterium]